MGQNPLPIGREDNTMGANFEPETIELMRKVLDEAWEGLPPTRRQAALKTDLAVRILSAAGHGERDPDRLRAVALYGRP